MALEVKGMHSSGTWLPATVESLTNQTILNDNGYIEYIPACGPVAQLGARFHGMEEVVGSIPTRSTKESEIYREFAAPLRGTFRSWFSTPNRPRFSRLLVN